MTVAIETGQKFRSVPPPPKTLGTLLLGLNVLLEFGSCLPKFGIHYFVICSPVFCCNSESCEVSNEPGFRNEKKTAVVT